MSSIFNDNSLSIGRTPLVKINRISTGCESAILAKIEGRNPAYSVKCRVGASMIRAAERDGILKPGSKDVTIIEPTSGNTGIGLAYVCAVRQYPCTILMPDTMSVERRRMLKIFGAELILTEGAKGMSGAIARAEELVEANPDKFFMPQQFSNPANPEIHFRTTGPEIWADTDGKVDMIVAGVGTGGTITGISRYIKESQKKPIQSVAVEPANSPVLTAIINNEQPVPGSHKIQGIGAGFKPEILDLGLIDQVEKVGDDEAIEMALRLHREEGITAGISSGAAMTAAVRLGRKAENKGKIIVVILPDSGERYLSSVLFEGIDA